MPRPAKTLAGQSRKAASRMEPVLPVRFTRPRRPLVFALPDITPRVRWSKPSVADFLAGADVVTPSTCQGCRGSAESGGEWVTRPTRRGFGFSTDPVQFGSGGVFQWIPHLHTGRQSHAGPPQRPARSPSPLRGFGIFTPMPTRCATTALPVVIPGAPTSRCCSRVASPAACRHPSAARPGLPDRHRPSHLICCRASGKLRK